MGLLREEVSEWGREEEGEHTPLTDKYCQRRQEAHRCKEGVLGRGVI